VETAVLHLDRLEEEAGDDPLVRHFLLGVRAVAEAMTRSFDRAWQLVGQVRPLLLEMGSDAGAAGSCTYVFEIARRQGPLTLAEPAVRAGDDTLAALGEQAVRSTVVCMRAHVHAAADQVEEAERCADLGRSMSDPNDLASQVLWRTALAQVHARRGAHEAAAELATEAVDLASASDWLCLRGDALLDRAEVRRRAGRHGDAAGDADAALTLYERKGDQASADRARRALQELRAPSDVGPRQPGG